MRNTVTARIDLSVLGENLALIRKLCPRSQVMAMVKADGYGHGLLQVARALRFADGLAVARLKEAISLRESGLTNRILLLGTLLDSADIAVCGELRIDITAHDPPSVSAIAAHALRTPLRVWLKLDSGMHRIGLDPTSFVEADRLLSRHAGVLELIHMTHFSSADDIMSVATDRQLTCFFQCHRRSSRAKISLANSAALLTRPETHGDWVRPGILLYGCNPMDARHPIPVRPVMTLKSRIIALREIGPGESVGYNRIWTSNRGSRIGTVGVGYGDGYPRHAKNGTPIWTSGQTVPLIGRVSMDTLAVDMTDCPKGTVGDEVVLWGTELPAPILAKWSDTIPYELFTSLQQRVDRQYIQNA